MSAGGRSGNRDPVQQVFFDMRNINPSLRRWVVHGFFLALMIPLMSGIPVRAEEEEKKPLPPRKTVKGHMQSRPGGPTWDVEVKVHPAPDDLPSVPAAAAPINDSDLVLGVVLDGQAVAFPIRFLAMYEVIDSRVGDTPVAPTW